MKIHIVGGAGTGKTWVSSLITKEFGVPHYDLDDLFWDKAANTYGMKAQPAARDAELAAVIRTERWVIEGIYVEDWVAPSLAAADQIFAIVPPIEVLTSLRSRCSP